MKNADNDDVPLWGASAIAEVLNCKPRKAFYLLENKLVDATKCGAPVGVNPTQVAAIHCRG